MCPTVSGKRCYTGCVATAMVQIMRYYGYPEKGTQSKSYTTQTHGLQLSFDFGQTTFDWDNILPAYTSGQFNTAEADAVAELMFACGVAASMDYDPAWASSSLIYAFTGVTSYFGYNPYTYIAHDFNYSLEGWTDLLKSEMNARRPVIFTASDAAFNAHAFVLDGYDEEGLFHVNWGWGGTNDGYYLVTRLDPGVTSAGEGGNSGYQFEQTILVGLLPKSDTVKVQSHFEAECLKVDTVNRTARIERIYNRSSLFSGRMAIIAELDDVQQVISDEIVRTDVGFGSGFGWVDFTLNIPSGLSDGVYDVYMGTKPDNGTRWDQVVTRYGLSPDYALVVDGGVARIVEDDDATLKPEVKVIPAGELHSNRAEIFMIAIKNPRQHHEFAGWIDLTLLDDEQYYLYNERIEQVYLEPGEVDTIRCVMNMPEYEGKAYICASWFYDSESHYVSEPLEVTIGAQGQRATTVRAIRCKLANSRVETHTDVVCTGQLGISGAGDYFDGALVASLYRNNSSSAAVQTQRIPVSLQKGEVQDFTVKLNADVAPGSYSFRLYSYDATKSSPLTQLWTSSVFVTVAVGIPSVEAESQLQAAVDKGASVVHLTSDQPLRSVRLYSAGGAQLRQATFQGDERAYSLNVAGLPSGTYVVQVALADGTTQQVKFVR